MDTVKAQLDEFKPLCLAKSSSAEQQDETGEQIDAP